MFMAKKGDTLVEVTLAVGIFSMIAIAVVSLMNSGTSNAQLALETTLAREEIDAQADALRFVHNAYASNKEGETQPLTVLWKEIIANAIDLSKLNDTEKKSITEYAPASCGSAIPSSAISKGKGKAFVLNTRDLNAGKSAYSEVKNINQVSTYPRLVYNGDSSALAGDASSTNLSWSEGIYVIAVKDPNSTKVVDVDGTQSDSKSAYYDFYIRTCWYGSGDTAPSTISTEIRLHDTDSSQSALGKLEVVLHIPGEGIKTKIGSIITLPTLTKDHYTFVGWCTKEPNNDVCEGDIKTGTLQNLNKNTTVAYELYPIWELYKNTISYNTNGASQALSNKECYREDGSCPIDYSVTRPGYDFLGWCSGTVNDISCNGGHFYQNGEAMDLKEYPPNQTILLTAVWARTLTVSNGNWSPSQCGEPHTTHGFTIGGEHDLYASIQGTCPEIQGGDGRASYSVKIGNLSRGDVITFDWNSRNRVTETRLITCHSTILGKTISYPCFENYYVTSDDITTFSGQTIKPASTDGPNSGSSTASYTATQDNDGIMLNMRYGADSKYDGNHSCYIWLNNIKVNGKSVRLK